MQAKRLLKSFIVLLGGYMENINWHSSGQGFKHKYKRSQGADLIFFNLDSIKSMDSNKKHSRKNETITIFICYQLFIHPFVALLIIIWKVYLICNIQQLLRVKKRADLFVQHSHIKK